MGNSNETRLSLGGKSVKDFNLLAILGRRWRLIAAYVAGCMLLSVGYYLVAKTKYESKTQVLIIKKDANLPVRGMETLKDSAVQVSEDLLATHVQIVQSPQVVRHALASHGLENLPSLLARLAPDQEGFEYVIDHLRVSRGGSGQARLANVLNISFRHTSDVDAQAIVEAVVDSYRTFLADKFQDVSKEAVSLIRQATHDLADDLEKAERDYQQFRENAPILFSGDHSSNTHRQNFERLQESLADLRAESAAVQSRLETIDRVCQHAEGTLGDLDLLALLDDSHIQRLGLLVNVKRGGADTEEFQVTVPTRTANARAEYEGLLALGMKEKTLLMDYGPDHPLVQDVRQQIEATKSFLEKKKTQLEDDDQRMKLDAPHLLSAYRKLLSNDLETISTRQAALERLSAQEESDAKSLVSAELRGEALRKQVARKQEMYDAVRDRLRDINLVTDYGGIDTEILEPAKLGIVTWPKLPIVLALGILVGAVVGASAAVTAEYFDSTFRSVDELQETLRLPILARVPRIRSIDIDDDAYDGQSIDRTIVAFYRPKSVEAESFHALRTSLFLHSRGRDLKVVLCTSSRPGSGKSLIAANLATSIARSGRRVLLIDADLRWPRIHQLIALDTTKGLSSVLNGTIEPSEAIQTTDVENLMAVPCGPIPAFPSELLCSAAFDECLRYYRDHFDFIVIDSSPLLPVSDPSIIAPLVDAVVIAVRLQADLQSDLMRSLELLERNGSNILGIVANDGDSPSASYGYGRGYGGYGDYAACASREDEADSSHTQNGS